MSAFLSDCFSEHTLFVSNPKPHAASIQVKIELFFVRDARSRCLKPKKASRRWRLAFEIVLGQLGLLHDVRSLRAFFPFDDFEFHDIAFPQRAVSVPGNCRVVNENIRPLIPAYESVTFGVAEPFHFSGHARVPPFLLETI
jgi:hypothetical protein